MQGKKNKTFQHRGSVHLTETQQRIQRAAHIFHEYGDHIREMIRYSVRDESLVDDIYQDLFISLVSANLPPKIKNMRRFLYRAITNDIISMARRTKRRNQLMKSYAQEFRCAGLEEESPGERMVRHESVTRVLSRSKKHLSPSEYKAVLWRFQEDGDNEEAAKELGVKKRSFIRYLCVGMKKLRDLESSEEGLSA